MYNCHLCQAVESTDASAPALPNRSPLQNIYHIAFLLRQKLVSDVVPAILHHAGLFERTVCSTGLMDEIVVTQARAPTKILVTKPLRSSARLQCPVRKVTFAFKSCDQGWATGGGSHTWFSARILPVTARSSARSDTSEAQDGEIQDESRADCEREVARNERASRSFGTHIIEWTSDSVDPEERQWVARLQQGDRIEVLAWACYPGWQNRVRSASVAICTAAIV